MMDRDALRRELRGLTERPAPAPEAERKRSMPWIGRRHARKRRNAGRLPSAPGRPASQELKGGPPARRGGG